MLNGGLSSAYPPATTPRMPISSMIHQPSFSRCCTAPTMLEAPSTRIAAAKNIESTSRAIPGLRNAKMPKTTEARPPTRNTHQVRRHNACALAPRFARIPLLLLIVCSLVPAGALSFAWKYPCHGLYRLACRDSRHACRRRPRRGLRAAQARDPQLRRAGRTDDGRAGAGLAGTVAALRPRGDGRDARPRRGFRPRAPRARSRSASATANRWSRWRRRTRTTTSSASRCTVPASAT